MNEYYFVQIQFQPKMWKKRLNMMLHITKYVLRSTIQCKLEFQANPPF